MIDRKIFFDDVRYAFGALKQSQVDGFNALLDTFERDYNWPDLRWLSYCLATAWHETAKTMQPIKEYGSESYLKSKPYYPYVGRGYVQLTWDYNYEKMGKKLGVNLMGMDKDKALDPQIAAEILFTGMRDGDFTGKSLEDYFDHDTDDPKNARRIVNGTDKAAMIADYHTIFGDCLSHATVEVTPPEPPAIDLSEYVRRDVMAKHLRDLADAIERGDMP